MEESDYEEYLLEEDQVESKKSGGCMSCFCSYLFCYCLCQEQEISKSYYINKWRKYLSNESEHIISQPFRILTHLFAHKNVIRELENIRLNPNLVSEKNIRNDLEFYIPQLCTFLIFGDYEAVEEFLAFLCKACYASFFLAHRVIWFLKSLLNNSNMNEKIEYILHLIQTIFKSEKDKTKLERLHIANSKKYVDLMAKYNLLVLYRVDAEVDENLLTEKEREIYMIYKASKNLIVDFCNRHYQYAIENSNEEFAWNFFLQPEDVFVNIYRNSMMNCGINNNGLMDSELDSDTNENGKGNSNGNSEDNHCKDVNLHSFLSSINFIHQLCEICEKMKDLPNDDQMAFLQKEISEINKQLPSNVYIPFLKDSIRNYIICHIPVTEMKIFRTKNRAPYMITVEVIRIDEIVTQILRKNKIGPSNNVSRNNVTTSKNSGQPYEDSRHSVNNTYMYYPPNKGRSFSISEGGVKAEDIISRESMEKRKQNAKSFMHDENVGVNGKSNKNKISNMEMRKRSSTQRMLEESDIKLSKPVIISILEAENKRTPLRGERKIILEEKEDYEESFVKEDMDEIVKRRLTAHPLREKRKTDEGVLYKDKDKQNKISTQDVIEENKEAEDEENSEIIKFKSKGRNMTTCDPMRRSKGMDISLNKEDDDEPIDHIHIISPRQNSLADSNNGSVNIQFENIFGEFFEEQSERVKKTSPFGKFNTWQLFKMIVKSGEDLRQEQFATQLINEFQQIFQMEKVGCWVNTYEILATGNNVGIIEVVPNAISIDQLKKKIKNNSLRTFFENYFGPTDSKRFKTAMNNFISSLAGYSLVCYFLQIKDRHNANILINNEGYLVHIDFGFLLSNAPGKGIKFEKAPFKLTNEVVDTMGGVNSKYFAKFRKLLCKGFLALVKHCDKILILVEMMYCGHGKNLPCFEHKGYTIDALKSRFFPKPNMKKHDYIRHVDELIEHSIDNWRTRWYDRFQYYFQGIFY